MEEIIKNCFRIINNEIARAYHKEAREIIKLTTDKYRQEFIDYHIQDKGNICCLVLDTAKRDLVKEGKMVQDKHDGFGHKLKL